METLQDYQILVQMAAEHLAGDNKQVLVRYQAPAFAAVPGASIKTKTGYVIDLDPSLDPAKQLFVLLHELAHIKLHTFTELDHIPNLTPRLITLSLEDLDAIDDTDYTEEIEANKQATAWRQYADKNHVQFYGGPIVSRLFALMNWYATEEERETDRIYQFVKAALQKKANKDMYQ